MNSQKKYDVFISYSRKDLDEVSTFVEMLKTRIPTLEVWMDLEGITAADEFDEKIISAIDASSHVIFAVSRNSNSIGEGSSKWTKKELVYAKNTGKKVIPVLLSGAELNNWFLFEFGRVDCIDSTSKHQLEKLLKNIAKWTNKELLKPQKEKIVLTLDEQQLLNEARILKDRIEKNKRVAKIALISVLALSVLTISIVFGINRYKAYKAIQYTVINDSVAPYTIEISGFELINGYIPKKISIPKKIKKNDTTYLVTRIGDGAFAGCESLTSVTIPNSVTSIGDWAFSRCSNLTSITIPSSVIWIANGVFYNCSSLTYVTIPNSVTEIGSEAFAGCESLISITIPNSVTSIGDWAFAGCESLTSVTIPNSVTEIGLEAFAECSSLNSVTIPSSTTSIGGRAFVGTALYNDPSNWENGALYINECLIAVDTNCVGNYIIKENTRLIGKVAFISCSALTSVTIPNSVTSIGYGAFYACESLETIVFDGTMEQWLSVDKETHWEDDVPIKVIYCTDGYITLPE